MDTILVVSIPILSYYVLMKNTMLPSFIHDTNPPARKSTRTNLDVLFSALILLLNIRINSIASNDLVAILNSMHHQVIALVDENPTDTIKLLKLLAAWFLSFIRGARDPKGNIPLAHWSISHNCPSLFIELIPFFVKELKAIWLSDENAKLMIQVIYAFLNCHRVIVTPMKIDLSTITDGGISALPNHTPQYLSALNALGITPADFQSVLSANCANAKLRIINTAGPNGQATWTAHEDAIAIMRSPSLFSAFSALANSLNMSWIVEQMAACAAAPESLKGSKPGQPLVTGRLHAIEEWGGKTRIVAIVDYWTQALLSPLHDTIAHFLRRLEQDGTFNQDKIINRVHGWTTDPNVNVYSYDLTAATDRLPIKMQADLLSVLFSDPEMAKLWSTVMADREFLTPEGTYVKYAVGQPMGSKSSFPMLGLLHHVIVQIAADTAKVKKYSKYVVLGDDVTLTNGDVASAYKAIMDSIGVPINLSKSVYHKVGLSPAGEICKRTFVSGVDITALPVKLIVKTQKSGYLASDLQNVIAKRGWAIPKTEFLQFAAGLIDRKSLQALVLLNAIPTSVSGLTDSLDVSAYVDLSTAFHDTLTFDDSSLENAFTFALVSEQLKRVDSLLKNTEMMFQTIGNLAIPGEGYEVPVFPLDHLSEKERANAYKVLPKLSWSHPIVHAGVEEYQRVTSHLNGLRAGTAEMVTKARAGLLDLLRNSLHDIWLTESERAGVVQRSIFNAALAAIKKLVSDKSIDPTSKVNVVNFSILLSYVQRMWSVRWAYGSTLQINAVKSKVSVSSVDAQTKLSGLFDKTKITEIRI